MREVKDICVCTIGEDPFFEEVTLVEFASLVVTRTLEESQVIQVSLVSLVTRAMSVKCY